MATRMQQRRGTAAQWISTNGGNGPILAAGEIGFESDNNKFKIGDGVNHWVDLTYFTDAASAIDALTGLVDGAPALLDTLNELAAAIGDDPAFITTVATNLSNHQSDTTNIHGILDTNELATKEYVTTEIGNSELDKANFAGVGLDYNAVTDALDIDSTVATKTYADEAAEAAQTAAEITASGALSTHSSDTTSVHGITDTAELATKTFAAELLTNATKTNVTITGDKNGLTITAENGVADSNTDNLTEGSTNKYFTDERAQDAVGNSVGTGLTYTDSTGAISVTPNTYDAYGSASAVSGNLSTHALDTTDIHGIADTSLLATKAYADAAVAAVVDAAPASLNTLKELATALADDANYATTVNNALAAKAPLASPAFSGTVTGITKAMVGLGSVDNTADTAKPVSDATQTVLNLKAPINSPTFTGTIGGITKSMVGLGNVDNTSDANKPVSTAAQTALDLKAPLANPTFTGIVTLPANTISQSMMGDDSVGTNEIGGLAVTTEKIAALAVTEGKIADSAVTSAKIADGTIVNADINASAAIAQSKVAALTTDLAAKLALAGGTMTGALTLHSAPTSDLHAATKLYVDNVTAGINFHQAVHTATTAELSAVYNNGTGGVGATLTANGGQQNTVLVIDVQTMNAGERVLVKNQATAIQNGIYVVTDAGKVNPGGRNWVLTRATDADNNPTGELKSGDFCLVLTGDINASYGYINSSATNPIAIGTDAITYSAFNAAKTISAGNGLQEETPGILSINTTVTQTRVSGVTDTKIGYLSSVTSDIQTQLDAKLASSTASSTYAPINSPTFTGTVSGITKSMVGLANVDNTSDANKPVSTAIQTALDFKAPISNPTFTGTVAGITKSMVGLGNVDNTADANKPVSSATQTSLDLKAPIASPTFTGTVTLPTGTVTSGMILDGTIVDGDISSSAAIAQSKVSGLTTDLGLKAALASPALTGTPTAPTATAGTNTTQVATTAFVGTAVADLVASAPAALNTLNELATALGNDASFSTTVTNSLAAKAPLNSPTFTGTVSGISKSMVGLANVDNTSDVSKPVSNATQTALDLKAPLANPTFTGTVAGITKSMVGLANVDNTADANKPVSTATQTALDLKANIASPTFTGTITIPQARITGVSTTVSANTATTVSTVDLASFTTIDYTVSIKQGSKIRSSKVLVQTNGTTVDSVEHSILETGGSMSGVNVTAAVSSTNAILTVTITDASSTNATVKVINTII